MELLDQGLRTELKNFWPLVGCGKLKAFATIKMGAIFIRAEKAADGDIVLLRAE